MNSSLANLSDKNGVYIESPLSNGMLEKLNLFFETQHSSKFKNEYLQLLHYSDGVQIENVVINSSHDMLNSNNHRKGVLVIGFNGNMDAYIFDTTNDKYQVVNFFNHAEVQDVFNSLNDMLNDILLSQGVIKKV